MAYKVSRKVIISNFLSLSSVQIANYILPLITIPYVVRIIGPEKFGVVNFAQAIIGYFMVLTNFGINLSGTREIAIIRDDPAALGKTFMTLMSGRLYLCLASLLIFIPLVLFAPNISEYRPVFLASFLMVVTEILLPVWFFQGMEKMSYIAILNFVAKACTTALIFFVVKNEGDYVLLPLLNAASSLLVGIAALAIIFTTFRMSLLIPRLADVYSFLRKSFAIFVSDVYASVYTASYPVVLGIVANYTVVGYYTGAQKIVMAWLGLQNLLVTTAYPHVSRLASENRDRAIQFLQKATVLCLIVSISSAIFTYRFSEEIVMLLLGARFEASALLLKIMSVLLVLVTLNVHMTFQGMLAFRKDRDFNCARLVGGISALLFVFPLSYVYKDVGTSLTFVISEASVGIASIYFLARSRIKLVTSKQIYRVVAYTALTILAVLTGSSILTNSLLEVVLYLSAAMAFAYMLF